MDGVKTITLVPVFPGFDLAGNIRFSRSRNNVTQIYNAILPPFIGPGHNEFRFFHDAPTYWGMSGGPIANIHIVAGNPVVDIYGIVKGTDIQLDGNNALVSQCQGTFIRRFGW